MANKLIFNLAKNLTVLSLGSHASSRLYRKKHLQYQVSPFCCLQENMNWPSDNL